MIKIGQYYMPVLSRAGDRDKFVEGAFAKVYSHNHNNGLKLMEHSFVGNEVPGIVMAAIADLPARVVWAGDYADAEPDGSTVYNLAEDLPEPKYQPKEFRYLINLDKRAYVDIEAVRDIHNEPGFRIHPLPLITCEGNGRGGGDFRGDNFNVGVWSRDVLTASDSVPFGFEEIIPEFEEHR